MPVDFSLLGKQPVGGVVANLPVNNNPSPLNSLAGGLMEGAKTASEIQAQQQSIAASKQSMDQNAQLFPSALAKSKADASSAQSDASIKGLQAKTAQQQYDDLQQSRVAFKKGVDQGIAALQASGPDGAKAAADIRKVQADTQLALSSAANQMADAQTKVNSAYTNMASTGAQMAATAANAEAKQPGMGQYVWNQSLQMMPESIRALYPQQYNPSTYFSMISIGHDAVTQMQEDKLAKDQPETVKLMKARDSIAAKIQNGTATDADKQDYADLNVKLSPKSADAKNPFDDAAAKEQMKQNTAIDNQSQQLTVVHDDAKDALEILKSIPEGYTGPIVDYLKANARSSDIQKIQKLLAGIPIAVKAMYGVTAGNRLTTTELQQLNKASGSTAINKDALTWVLNRLLPQTEGIMKSNWQVQESSYKNASPDVYNNWKQSHPEPKFGEDKAASSYSQEDLEHTAKLHNMTVDQVKAELAKRAK